VKVLLKRAKEKHNYYDDNDEHENNKKVRKR